MHDCIRIPPDLAVEVVSAYFCTTVADPVGAVVGWLGVAFLGLAFLVLFIAWIRAREPRTFISAEGIEDRRTCYGLIPWEDITMITIFTSETPPILSIHLYEPDKYLARAPKSEREVADFKQMLGHAPINLEYVDHDPSITMAYHYISNLGHIVRKR